MNEQKDKLNMFKVVMVSIAIIIMIIGVKNGINILRNISKVYVVELGSLKFQERAEAYILRDEKVLQGENYKNGMAQIISEGQRIAKNSPAFRYYSNGEEEILNQINTLDDEINAEIESSGLTIFSTDITNLENEIEDVVDSMYQLNDLANIQDKIAELDTYISKKTKITGNLSPADSHVKSLIEQRNALEAQLTNESEVVNSPEAGIISYRVDGLEEILGVNDFNYLSTDFLNSLNTKTGAIISTSNEKGKVVNNFDCYIACPINTEKSSSVKVGDSVKLNLPNSTDVDSTIEFIKEESDDKRIIVFKINDDVEDLVKYRKIFMDIVWWSYKGLKISNSSLEEENDLYYVEKSKAGYTEKIYVKVLRQNDTYSIVENYTDDELKELGFDIEYINKRQELNVYDEILLY